MMYVNVNDLEATKGNVVLNLRKWPSTIESTANIIIPDSVRNKYDNGRELYLGEVTSSGDENFITGDTVAVDIFYGVHVPSESRVGKVKIVPASGIVLKYSKKFKVMSDIVKMQPGIDRILIKLRKKESITASGIHIPTETLSQDPTAQDIRVADVIRSSADSIDEGDVVVIEAFTGKDVYLDVDSDLYVVCYAFDIVAKIKQ